MAEIHQNYASINFNQKLAKRKKSTNVGKSHPRLTQLLLTLNIFDRP